MSMAKNVSNVETRKLYLYSQDNFSSVDAVAVNIFVQLTNIRVSERAEAAEKGKASQDQRAWMFKYWPIVLERHSTLRAKPTFVAGAKEILKFLYQTEILEYHWYPQNPLDRARLDNFLAWHTKQVDSLGLLTEQDALETMEDKFMDKVHPYTLGFSAMTICDIIAFVSVAPAHLKSLESMRDSLPKTSRWLSKMAENEDAMQCLSELKLELPAAKL